jgi:mannose-6-phosphate isomerase
MEHHEREVLGSAAAATDHRFPLLCKILDARDRLSLQVHPPVAAARELGGEPKTEMWYIAEAGPGAELYVGLKHGITRSQFEERLRGGSVEECFHRIPVHQGDTMFLPSGRVHAIGAGLVIFEIQQNSDTTYRVFDWNRVGLDGQPRALHVPQSLASIDFDDVEPALVAGESSMSGAFHINALVRHTLFKADLLHASGPDTMVLREALLRIAVVIDQRVTVTGGGVSVSLQPGQFCVIPAALNDVTLKGEAGSRFLLVEPGPLADSAG